MSAWDGRDSESSQGMRCIPTERGVTRRFSGNAFRDSWLETTGDGLAFFSVSARASGVPSTRLYPRPLHQPGRYSRPAGDPPRAGDPVRRASFETVLHFSSRCSKATVPHGRRGDLEIRAVHPSHRRPIQDPIQHGEFDLGQREHPDRPRPRDQWPDTGARYGRPGSGHGTATRGNACTEARTIGGVRRGRVPGANSGGLTRGPLPCDRWTYARASACQA